MPERTILQNLQNHRPMPLNNGLMSVEVCTPAAVAFVRGDTTGVAAGEGLHWRNRNESCHHQQERAHERG